MAFAARRLVSKKGLPRTAGVLAALAVGTTLLAAPAASAADQPTTRELLEACGVTTSFCKFHPQSFEEYTGPTHRVGTVYNCGSQTNELTVGSSETVGSSDSVGVAITATAGFAKVFEVAVETSYNHTWERSHTDTVESKVNVQSHHKAWIDRGSPKQKATGWYEIQFKNRHWGHFDWYVYNYTESGWDNQKAGFSVPNDAPMTQAEIGAHCRS
ncbi:hypothetical protein [Streptomyces geranii]|uniref:hypothetical protein n=1 Tax=Streptomyces geranii TaxID=2058923 RepID=UPI000D0406EB|nr:hypothetical protein [Streptomyces geranii]